MTTTTQTENTTSKPTPTLTPTAATELERLASHAVQLVDDLLVTRSKLVTPLVDAAHSALTNLARGVDRTTARWLAGDKPATGGQ